MVGISYNTKKMRPIWNNLFVWHKTVHRELIFKHPLMSNIIIDASHFYKLALPSLNCMILKTIKILSLTFKVNTLFLRKLTCNHHCIYYQASLSLNGLAPCKTLWTVTKTSNLCNTVLYKRRRYGTNSGIYN